MCAIFLESTFEEGIERRERTENGAWRIGLGAHDHREARELRHADERLATRDDFVEHHRDAPQIAPMVGVACAARLLGAHEGGRSEEHAGARAASDAAGDVHDFGDSEIENLHGVAGHDENIFGLEIAMHDALCVRCGEPCKNTLRDVDGAHRGNRMTHGRDLVERVTLEALHHQKWAPVFRFAHFEHAKDIGMLQTHARSAFVEKTQAHLRVAEVLGAQQLDRNAAPRRRDHLGFVDQPHAALAQQIEQAEATREDRADERRLAGVGGLHHRGHRSMLPAMLRRVLVSSLSVMLFASLAGTAFADAPEDDKIEKPRTEVSKDVVRPWLYNDDPTIPSPLHVVASLADTYSGKDRSVSRAFASTDDGPGAKVSASAELGLTRMLAFDFTGVLGGYGAGISSGLMTGLRFAPFDLASHGFRLAVAAGYLLDLDTSSGIYGRVAATYDVGRVRLATMVHVEHVFRTGDAVDVFATAGVSARVVPAFRLGIEYIVQDIEEAFASKGDPDEVAPPGRAEGGVHQFVGITGTVELLHHKLFLNFGPALAFRTEIGQVAPVGRAVVSYSF